MGLRAREVSMENVFVHEICGMTGKWMLSERDAGNIVRVAKRINSGGEIPKGRYFCSFCRTYHTTHFALSNEQKQRKAVKRLAAYKRTNVTRLRLFDYML